MLILYDFNVEQLSEFVRIAKNQERGVEYS